MNTLVRSTSAVLALCLFPFTIQAATIVSNTAAATSGLNLADPSILIAQQFTSPNTATSITGVFLNGAGSVSPLVSLTLFSDGAGRPGTALAPLGTQVITTPGPTFTPPSPVSLAESTIYWLVLGCSNCINTPPTVITTSWLSSATPTVNGLPGSGVGSSGLLIGSSFLPSGRSFVFRIDGEATAIPEPGTWALAGTALGFLLLTARLRRTE